MQAKTPTQKQPPPGATRPLPDLSDMDHFHRMVASGKLADVLAKIGKP
jgi:hypothetical protein